MQDELDSLSIGYMSKNALRKAGVVTIEAVKKLCLHNKLDEIDGIGPQLEKEIRNAIQIWTDRVAMAERTARNQPAYRPFGRQRNSSVWMVMAFSCVAMIMSMAMVLLYGQSRLFWVVSVWALSIVAGLSSAALTGKLVARVKDSPWVKIPASATGGFGVWLITLLLLLAFVPKQQALSPQDISRLNTELKLKYGPEVGLEVVYDEAGEPTKVILIGLTPDNKTQVIGLVKSRVPGGISIISKDNPPIITEEMVEKLAAATNSEMHEYYRSKWREVPILNDHIIRITYRLHSGGRAATLFIHDTIAEDRKRIEQIVRYRLPKEISIEFVNEMLPRPRADD